jgi:hypothetical protein
MDAEMQGISRFLTPFFRVLSLNLDSRQGTQVKKRMSEKLVSLMTVIATSGLTQYNLFVPISNSSTLTITMIQNMR